MNPYRYIRWILLGMSLLAILGLAGMNAYSLYALHENKVQSTVEKQKRQLMEYSNQARNRFRYPINELWRMDMDYIQASLHTPETVADDLLSAMMSVSSDSMFTEIFLNPVECLDCTLHDSPIWKFDNDKKTFRVYSGYNHLVTDGLALAKTRMNALATEYRWTTRVLFDAHHSMTIALVNPDRQAIIGYLIFLIDREYLVNEFLGPKILQTFGTSEESGIVVWLHDWTKNQVLATNDHEMPYSYQSVDVIQNFPDLLNDWNLKAAFTSNPSIAASRVSLTRNLVMLIGAMFLLLGALFFMFFTAQRERSLAQRQTLFLANVTHELQTPLSVILAAGENLSDGRVTDPGRIQSYGNHIYTESMRLRHMIDRLLDVARSESARPRQQPQAVDLIAFTQDYLRKKSGYLESLDVQTHIDMPETLPDVVVDPYDLNSILNNLVDNAVKYSPGKKFVGIHLTNNAGSVKMSVSDRGIGIPRDSLKYIFDKFFRVEDTLTAQTKGHGLGLSIVKDLVLRNNMTIKVNSSPGLGTTFTLSFPLSEHHHHTVVSSPNEQKESADVYK